MKHRAKKSTQAAPPGHKHLINVISALPYIIITLATVIYFWEIISSRNFLWEDILYQYYPFHYFLFNSLRHFSIPAWNPFMFAGMPFLADIQTQVFYPLNWLFALISSSNQNYVFWLVELKCILHIVLAGIGFYLLMRELKLSGYAGIISGLTFALSGFMVMHLIHLTLVSTFAWFPLILFFFYRTLLNRKLGDATCAGIIMVLSNLAGHPQMTLHIVFAT
ncbi:MAG: YfhO family protein, partial [bacterium]